MKDIYLDFKDSDIRGNGREPKHPGAVAAARFEQRILPIDSDAHDSKRIVFSDLIFSRVADCATGALQAAFNSSTLIQEIEVSFYQTTRLPSGSAVHQKFYTLDLRQVILTSMVLADPMDADSFETFTLRPRVMTWRYDYRSP